MMKFTVPPEYCLIINAFNQASSLRGAAALLGMDPPSLVRKVQKISSEFGYLQKVGNKWAVTEAGRRVALWTEEIMQSQSELAQEKSTLRISSFAWLAEEMLIPEFAKLQKLLKTGQSCSFKLTASNQEQELLQGRTDLVIQGHAPTDPSIAYKKISSYDWVVVAPYAWKKQFSGLNEDQTVQLLHKRSFIPHTSLNPENALGFQPLTRAPITADAVIGLRSAVVHGEGWSALPAMSVHNYLRDKKLLKLNLPSYIKDDVSVWWVRARKDMAETSKVVSKWITGFEIS
ncbi:LysR substrate-binding domain-containing protein [Bdellovibrio sp. HCB337]|uniref:LysR substrate-binding domain-containing protein n=1 Tax=Bdellovibrio sp. HCB337 TaxID=3394358 RepID=UPI0039A598B2